MYPGSNTKEGYLYHDHPFERRDNVQRSDCSKRLEHILLHLDPRDKTILDLGCNIGYFTFNIAKLGAAAVIGVDHDTDALRLANDIVENHAIQNVRFTENITSKILGQKYDVLLALSVIPWLYKTMPKDEADALDKNLFNIKTAFVELMYEGDGRAPMEGIKNDKDARAYLEQFYEYVWPIYRGDDQTDGVSRRRTIWKCCKEIDVQVKEEPDIVGAQSFVYLGDNFVIKKGRSPERYNAWREYCRLSDVRHTFMAPWPISHNQGDNSVVLARIHASPLSDCKRGAPKTLAEGLRRILAGLRANAVQHHDIRPQNIMVRGDLVRLIDFGWAESHDDRCEVPKTINPEYGPDDEIAINKIINLYS